jgi:hypothetical protein
MKSSYVVVFLTAMVFLIASLPINAQSSYHVRSTCNRSTKWAKICSKINNGHRIYVSAISIDLAKSINASTSLCRLMALTKSSSRFHPLSLTITRCVDEPCHGLDRPLSVGVCHSPRAFVLPVPRNLGN